MVELSSKVKQANFRLPLEYMSMIDDFASRENITKAARALYIAPSSLIQQIDLLEQRLGIVRFG